MRNIEVIAGRWHEVSLWHWSTNQRSRWDNVPFLPAHLVTTEHAISLSMLQSKPPPPFVFICISEFLATTTYLPPSKPWNNHSLLVFKTVPLIGLYRSIIALYRSGNTIYRIRSIGRPVSSSTNRKIGIFMPNSNSKKVGLENPLCISYIYKIWWDKKQSIGLRKKGKWKQKSACVFLKYIQCLHPTLCTKSVSFSSMVFSYTQKWCNRRKLSL